jgi:hypothetical protein
MISLDWTLFVQMAIFLAFVVYLNNFLLKPLSAYVTRRKVTIEGLQESGGEQDTALEAIQKDPPGRKPLTSRIPFSKRRKRNPTRSLRRGKQS